MPEELNENENKEAWKVVQGLDSMDFMFKGFDEWPKANGFQLDEFGDPICYRGTYGLVQFEWIIFGGESRVVKCNYFSLSDKSRAYALETEGVSASGKSFSNRDLELLKQARYKQVEVIVKDAFEEQGFNPVEPQMSIRDDLDLGEDDIQEIIMKLEDEFNCSIPDEEIKRFKIIADVVSFIRKEKGMSI